MEADLILSDKHIQNKIYTIRDMQVMLDNDLAKLYEVKTKRLNEQVRRNINRFPWDFMFQLTSSEKNELVAKCDHLNNLKFSSTNPYVFTQEGVASLSGVLKSKKAEEVNINVMRAFVNMRKFIVKNAEIFSHIDYVERKQTEFQIKIDKKFEQVFKAIEDKSIVPDKRIFFGGQVFDAYKFVSDILRIANQSIILIDNYIDDSVLTLFGKRNKNVKVSIFMKEISKQLALDMTKFNSQYSPIEIKKFKLSHDRFLIIDNKTVYHFGASLKDLGKKWFAFSKFDKEAFSILNKLGIK